MPVKDSSLQPTFTGDKLTIALPGPIDDVAIGANGRFLVGHLKGQRKLVIVDTFEAKVAKILPLPPGGIAFAAGRNYLLIAEREAGVVTRYNLKTFEKEIAATSVVDGPIRAIAIGCDAVGPLVVCSEKSSALINPNTMKAERFVWNPPAGQLHPRSVGASADGRIIVGYNDPASGPVVSLTVTLDNILDRRVSPNLRAATTLLPSADGATLFDATAKPTLSWSGTLTRSISLESALPHIAPSLDPAFFTAWEGSKDVKPKAAIYSLADRRRLIEIDSLDELAEDSELPATTRLHYIAKANLLVTLCDEKVVVRKFDLLKTLEEKGTDFLFITSAAPASVVKGKPLIYTVTAKSRRGGMKFSIEGGPKGMTISPAGLLRWTVPPAAKETEALVTVKVTDASEQMVFQEFWVSLVDPPTKPTQTAAGKGNKNDSRGVTDRALGPIEKLMKNQKE